MSIQEVNDVVQKTERGFELIRFEDKYKLVCSLQQSSAASEECIWLGIDDAKPQILATDALRLGLYDGPVPNGWIPYKIPDEVMLHTRMHLNRDQVQTLIRRLTHWVKTGQLQA